MAYIVVSADEFELPLMVGETAKDISVKTGRPEGTVYNAVSRKTRTWIGNQWVRILSIDLDKGD